MTSVFQVCIQANPNGADYRNQEHKSSLAGVALLATVSPCPQGSVHEEKMWYVSTPWKYHTEKSAQLKHNDSFLE
jgi:hypothetical protein